MRKAVEAWDVNMHAVNFKPIHFEQVGDVARGGCGAPGYRCFAMEVFWGQPPAPALIVVWSAPVFAAVHFMIGTPDLDRFLHLLGGAALFATVYYCSGSIWLLINLHSALSFYAFSLGGNWKMGGGELSGTLPAAGTRPAIEVLACLIASPPVPYFHRRADAAPDR